MEIARALILAGAGFDDRPWPSAPSAPRHLFPLANRPILFHNLEQLRTAGVLEAAILVEPDAAEAIERAVGDGRDWGLSVRYEAWRPAVGLRGALAGAQAFLRDEPVLVQRGDALLRERMYDHIVAFARERLDALALRLTGSDRASTPPPAPGYLLSPRAVSILLDGPQASSSPIAGVEAHGGRVRVHDVEGLLPCHGDLDMLLESNRAMLEKLTPSVDPSTLEGSVIQGVVDIHPTARLRRSTVRGPAIIGAGARLTDAYVGPYSSIGAGVVMEGAEVEHSIVLAEAELRSVGVRLESSVIGERARVVRSFQRPAALRLAVGEGAEITLS